MTDKVYRALCQLDPALEPWQKCEHEWSQQVNPYDYICGVCRVSMGEKSKEGYWLYGLPAFGDGVPRYGTVDELLALCVRLKVPKVSMYYDIEEDEQERYWACLESGAERDNTPYGLASGETMKEALEAAVLLYFGKWEECQ